MGRWSETVKPAVLMVVYQATLAIANLFYKVAAFDGMSMRVLIAYRFLLAAIFIDILAIVIERKKRPKLTRLVVVQSFVCGLLACSLAQNLYAQGLVLTSPTFSSAMVNLIPAITFLSAVCFRMERLGLGSKAGKAKLVGTIVCVGGAMVLTLYKGPEVNIWPKTWNLLHMIHRRGQLPKHQQPNIGLGAILVICSCLAVALGFIFQAKMLRNYPCTYSSTALITTMGAIQAIIFAMCMERSDWSQWKLGWNVRLLSVTYNGIVASGASFIVAGWCIKLRGPLYVSVFTPLMLVIVALSGSLVLDEKLHAGSIIGSVVIICGLYVVLWGKGQELKRMTELVLQSVQSSRKSNGGEAIDTQSEIDKNIPDANGVVGISSNELVLAYQESIDGYNFSAGDEIMEEGNGEKLKKAENI